MRKCNSQRLRVIRAGVSSFGVRKVQGVLQVNPNGPVERPKWNIERRQPFAKRNRPKKTASGFYSRISNYDGVGSSRTLVKSRYVYIDGRPSLSNEIDFNDVHACGVIRVSFREILFLAV